VRPAARGVLIAGSLALLLPKGAEAQLDVIGRLFEKATDASAFVQVGKLASSDDASERGNGLRGYGLEVLFGLGQIPSSAWDVELAIGYNYFTGFGAADPSVDMHGSVRAIPEISLYATYGPDGLPIVPYLGVHSGLLDLWHASVYDEEGRQYSVEGETFQAGVTGGLVWHGLWAESSWRVRDFGSLAWGLADGEVLPAAFPRRLDLSGITLRAGYQFNFKGVDAPAQP
jgi:hypothetical protein